MAVTSGDDKWKLTYWYPSNNHSGEDTSEYVMLRHEAGKAWVFESEPNNERSYMFARVLDDGDSLYAGTWYETTSPTGEFKGAQYSGAGQLLLNEAGDKLEGMWAGAGYDHDKKEMKVYSGKWVIERLN